MAFYHSNLLGTLASSFKINKANVSAASLTAARTFTLPDQSGTLALVTSVGDHEVTVRAGNGHGSANTCIRRFATMQRQQGTAVTYADSATLGSSFTINETGFYSIYYVDLTTTSSISVFGVSNNSAQLSTAISDITAANRLCYNSAFIVNSLYFAFDTANVGFDQGNWFVSSTPNVSYPSAVSRSLRLTAGDVIRPHTLGTANATADADTVFSIIKIGV